MAGVGIAVIAARGLPGWRRYVPLAAGLWFPFTVLCMALLGSWEAAKPASSLYTAVAWTVLAVVVLTTPAPPYPVKHGDMNHEQPTTNNQQRTRITLPPLP
jgi:hypothetical protein